MYVYSPSSWGPKLRMFYFFPAESVPTRDRFRVPTQRSLTFLLFASSKHAVIQFITFIAENVFRDYLFINLFTFKESPTSNICSALTGDLVFLLTIIHAKRRNTPWETNHAFCPGFAILEKKEKRITLILRSRYENNVFSLWKEFRLRLCKEKRKTGSLLTWANHPFKDSLLAKSDQSEDAYWIVDKIRQ